MSHTRTSMRHTCSSGRIVPEQPLCHDLPGPVATLLVGKVTVLSIFSCRERNAPDGSAQLHLQSCLPETVGSELQVKLSICTKYRKKETLNVPEAQPKRPYLRGTYRSYDTNCFKSNTFQERGTGGNCLGDLPRHYVSWFEESSYEKYL